METLLVDLQQRSYPIFIGEGLLTTPDIWAQYITKRGKVVIVTNETVQKWYLAPLTQSLQSSGFDVVSLILPDGEEYKNIESFNKIMTFMLEQNCGRDTTMFALGGGVIGDLTGFAAASFQRGVDFIQVPTTLLSQVDSSVGGKTGINHPLGKNMIGAFYQPKAVIIDLKVLATLPKRELSAGMAEVIKYGIIWDNEFFEYLEQVPNKFWQLDNEVLTHIIKRCCSIKAEVVSKDETEQNLRAILNLGHTFGHAIENFMGYGVWLHGEAVAAGSVIASRLASLRGKITAKELERIIDITKQYELPVGKPDNMELNDFTKLMIHDKKTKNGKVRFIIPDALGRASLYDNVTNQELSLAIK